MARKRRLHSDQFKFQVALIASKGFKTLNEIAALAAGLDGYFELYNYERAYQSLDYRVPADVHFAVNEPVLCRNDRS